MQFRLLIAVYSENHTEHMPTQWVKFKFLKILFCLFYEAATMPGYIVSMVGWLVNDEFDGIWKEAAVA